MHKVDDKLTWDEPLGSLQIPLPLRCTAPPRLWAAAATRTILPLVDNKDESLNIRCHQAKVIALEIANEFNVNRSCMEMIYMSPSPYYDAFDEVIDLRHFDLAKHHTAGLSLLEKSGQLLLAHMSPSTPGAKILRWRTQLCGAWLIKIADHTVTSIDKARKAFEMLSTTGAPSARLLFAHPEIRLDLLRGRLPIVSSKPFSLLTHVNSK